MTNLVAAFMTIACFIAGLLGVLILFFVQTPIVWLVALGGAFFGWLFASMIDEEPNP